jgi:hypothetical protein
LRVEGVKFDQSASAGKEAGTVANNFINTYEGIMAFGFDGTA